MSGDAAPAACSFQLASERRGVAALADVAIGDYDSLGYVPYGEGINENVARTLEYSYADWCILQAGLALGRPESELSRFREGALNYRNLFDPATKLMRAKNAGGDFVEPFSPYKWGDAYTEGNAWHYTWSVFHDIGGLMELMGGREEFARMLDSLFVVPPVYDDSYYGVRIHEITEMQVADMGNYAHGNQPAQHVILGTTSISNVSSPGSSPPVSAGVVNSGPQ